MYRARLFEYMSEREVFCLRTMGSTLSDCMAEAMDCSRGRMGGMHAFVAAPQDVVRTLQMRGGCR